MALFDLHKKIQHQNNYFRFPKPALGWFSLGLGLVISKINFLLGKISSKCKILTPRKFIPTSVKVLYLGNCCVVNFASYTKRGWRHLGW